MAREKVLSVGINDCVVQTFRCGGKGGQNKDKRDTGVRIIHGPSGARGESREERTQLLNKRKAFVRMANSAEFQHWVRCAHAKASGEIERWLDEEMRSENLIIE